MDDMGDVIFFWNFEKKKWKKRERELYLVIFFLDLSCVIKYFFN